MPLQPGSNASLPSNVPDHILQNRTAALTPETCQISTQWSMKLCPLFSCGWRRALRKFCAPFVCINNLVGYQCELGRQVSHIDYVSLYFDSGETQVAFGVII